VNGLFQKGQRGEVFMCSSMTEGDKGLGDFE
jgi:hypothetical protein